LSRKKKKQRRRDDDAAHRKKEGILLPPAKQGEVKSGSPWSIQEIRLFLVRRG